MTAGVIHYALVNIVRYIRIRGFSARRPSYVRASVKPIISLQYYMRHLLEYFDLHCLPFALHFLVFSSMTFEGNDHEVLDSL